MNERIKSRAAFEDAQTVIPGGVNSPVRALKSVGTTPLFVSSAMGPHITDIDGNKYIDFCMSWGVFILGHSNVLVNDAAAHAIMNGSSYGIPTLMETELAKKVRNAFPSMERLRFVNSGTEATMSAIRTARGFTRREIVIKFDGCYHGHADHLLVSAGSAVANITNASSAGVPGAFTKYTVSLPYNNTQTLEDYFHKNGDKVAAVIIEPVACNMGVVVPDENFLRATRTLTERYGAILIFDEVITGFRLAFGGAQERFGIHPDMTTVGKIVGGGYPAAAFGGRADIMAMLAPEGPVYQAGTLSGNPVAMAAGIETLRQLSVPGFYDKLEKKSDAFIQRLEKIIEGKGITLNHIGSMFTLFFNRLDKDYSNNAHTREVRDFEDTKRSDQERFAQYFRNMLAHGIYVSPSQFEGNFISETHSKEVLDYVLLSIEESIG